MTDMTVTLPKAWRSTFSDEDLKTITFSLDSLCQAVANASDCKVRISWAEFSDGSIEIVLMPMKDEAA